MKDDVLYQITGPHFVAGLGLNKETHRVTWCAPILHYMHHWSHAQVTGHCKEHGWQFERVSDETIHRAGEVHAGGRAPAGDEDVRPVLPSAHDEVVADPVLREGGGEQADDPGLRDRGVIGADEPAKVKPDPLVVLTHAQFFTLEWAEVHNGLPLAEIKGKTFNQLLDMRLVRIENKNVFITDLGREVLAKQ